MTNKELEKERQKTEKYRVFMGSIMVCIAYAAIAIILAILVFFTEMGKDIEKSYGTFIKTFIIGTTLIIIGIVFMILDWKPSEKEVVKRDIINPKSCPDYWTSEHVDTSALQTINLSNDCNLMGGDILINDFLHNDTNTNLFGNKCVNDDNIRAKPDGLTVDDLEVDGAYSGTGFTNTNLSDSEDKAKMLGAMASMNLLDQNTYNKTHFASASGNKIKCHEVYPEYLADLDSKEYANNGYTGSTNKFRCEYAKVCGVPWTEIGC